MQPGGMADVPWLLSFSRKNRPLFPFAIIFIRLSINQGPCRMFSICTTFSLGLHLLNCAIQCPELEH